MKRISALFALLALFFAGLALANTATITAATGSVQATTGAAAARTLRVGDVVRQGDTVTTGTGSSVVMKFEDGQVAALTANSRLAITAYQYNPQTQSGNVLLSLINGGMRAITGLIGRRTPDSVAYRAATATIGIRGTDITVATNQGEVVVVVNAGVATFTFQGRTITIQTGQAVTTIGGVIRQVTAAAAEQDIRGTALAAIIEAAKDPRVVSAISAANPGEPGAPRTPPSGTTTGTNPTGSSGGTGASGS